jgi:hypothetical protein
MPPKPTTSLPASNVVYPFFGCIAYACIKKCLRWVGGMAAACKVLFAAVEVWLGSLTYQDLSDLSEKSEIYLWVDTDSISVN